MICDVCKEQLSSGTVLTKLGNDIDYTECKKCGIVEVMDMDVASKGEEKDE